MKVVQVIENIEENRTEWIVSLTNHNPKVEDYFVVSDAKEAFRIKKMLERWGNRHGKSGVSSSLPSDAELSRIFKNYSDCYADTWHSERGFMQEGEVIQAMTEQRFIEAVKINKI